MVDKLWKNSETVAANARESALRLLELLGRLGETCAITQQTFVRSFSDICRRAILASETVRSVAKGESRAYLLIPYSQVKALNSHFSEVNNNLKAALNSFNSAMQAGQPVRYEPSNQHLYSSNGNAYNFGESLRQVEQNIDNLFAALAPVLVISRPKSVADFSDALDKISKNVEMSATAARVANEKSSEVAAHIAELETLRSRNLALAEELKLLHEQCDLYKRQIDDLAGKSNAQFSKLENIIERAIVLDADAKALHERMVGFDRKLSSREKEIESGRKTIAEVSQILKATGKEAENLVVQAKEVLGTATAAGLSESFIKEKASLDEKLGRLRKSIYVSIGFLFLSVLIATNSLPFLKEVISLPSVGSATGETNEVLKFISGMAIRIAIMFPSLVLTAFNINQYRQNFLLREQYAYKYTVAASIDGFRKQAPNHDQAMAAAAFEELLFNPITALKSIPQRQNTYISEIIAPITAAAKAAMKKRSDETESSEQENNKAA
ncbi:hypothetical protein HHL28_13655 [Aerophototrophica crusticola]|uniref:Uncharacterized protein n=1 Tax=Aerophototrophica crusticola TaxID=1709002 RepID=A0A858R950_9PROT|nr:hypothetical protein HHL28_13655 [Rhodospirillaceae bacterium B3]